MRGRADEGAPIVGRSYDLCASLYEHVNRFPRAQRTLLGRVILDEGLRMLAALTLANRLTDKRQALAEASGRLDALRITVRLAKRLGFLSNPGYASGSRTRAQPTTSGPTRRKCSESADSSLHYHAVAVASRALLTFGLLHGVAVRRLSSY